MPASRSPKKNAYEGISFRAVKRSASGTAKKNGTTSTTSAPKKGKKAHEDPEDVPELDTDSGTASEDDEFEPLRIPMGSKLRPSRYEKYHRSLKPKRGISKPIHVEGQDKIQEILRIFDTSMEYGPCVGFNRLDRWERANRLGLNPPIQVKEILLTNEGQSEEKYAENVFHDHEHGV